MALKHQCQANYVLFILKKTDFCVNLFIPSEKATVIGATLTFDVRDSHQREAGKSAILKTDSQS